MGISILRNLFILLINVFTFGFQNSFKDMKEETANMFLAYYKKKFRLKDTTAKGFKDWLLAGEECRVER